MTNNLFAINLELVSFPTDKLTIKALRTYYPEAFDLEPSNAPHNWSRVLIRTSLDDVLAAVIDSERILADMAFKAALGQPIKNDNRMGGYKAICDHLSSDYITLGLANGEHAAVELLRVIESQAETQARKLGGKTR